MGQERNSNWGVLTIFAAAIFVMAAYWIFSSDAPPNLVFGTAEYVLLGSILVMVVNLVGKFGASR
jgi:hypothetical protein